MFDGTSVLVRHASAALGTFEYCRTGAVWHLSHRTGWAMRDTAQSDTARAARTQYLEEHGWVASTAWMGRPEEREFTVLLSSFGSASPHIAVLYATDDETPVFSHWPEAVDDAVLNESLMLGEAPDSLEFEPDSWARLNLNGGT